MSKTKDFTPSLFPFLTIDHSNTPTLNDFIINDEYLQDTESFLPETIYNSFVKSEKIEAKTIDDGKTLVNYKKKQQTNDGPIITDSKQFIIEPNNEKKTPKKLDKKTPKKPAKTKKKNNNYKKKMTRGRR